MTLLSESVTLASGMDLAAEGAQEGQALIPAQGVDVHLPVPRSSPS